MAAEGTAANAIVGLLPGAVGGFWNVVVGHPFDLIKVRQQCTAITSSTAVCEVATALRVTPTGAAAACNSSTSVTSMLQSIVVQRGVTGLYAGVSAPLIAVVPAFALSFSTFEAARAAQLHNSPVQQLTLSQTALAGAASGVPVALILGPLEKIKCQMQTSSSSTSSSSSSSSFITCFKQTLQQGPRGSLFRGTGLTMLRDVPGNASYFASYELFKRALSFYNDDDQQQNQKLSLSSTLLAGGMAGVVNWIIAIPMDVVKSQWQVAPAHLYKNPLHLAHHLLNTQGPSAFFRGLGPALMRAFPANAACLLGVETVRNLLLNNNNNNL